MQKNEIVPIDAFGKDHWSLLAYIETRCVDFHKININTCEIDHDHLRCNTKRHPTLQGSRQAMATGMVWKSSYGTRLKGFDYDNTSELQMKQIVYHDDWDCLEDLEHAGLIEIISLINGFIKITDEGKKIANLIRNHKSSGGTFSTFEFVKNDKEGMIPA